MNIEDKLIDLKNNLKFKHYYINGAFFEILSHKEDEFEVEFIDDDKDEIIYTTKIKGGYWAKASKEYFVNWIINIKYDGYLIKSIPINFEGKRVYLHIDSKALGDTIGWFPYFEEFRKKHNCKVTVSTFWNNLFQKTYPQFDYVKPGSTVNDIIAMYQIGYFEPWGANYDMQPIDFRIIPLQKMATDILGLEYKEIKPKLYIDVKNKVNNSIGKYVCISEHSTAQAKYWNNENGWQEVVDYLISKGYKVVVLGIGKCKLRNVIPKTGKMSIEDIMSWILGCEFFIGISSGLSWLAWALEKEVIMISGFTKSFNEFLCHRIINKSICNGCWNDSRYIFDKGDWGWCPEHKGTDRHFECSKQIMATDVIEKINNIINNK